MRARPEWSGLAASFGIATRDAAPNAAGLLDRADKAMYAARRSGGDRIAVGRLARGPSETPRPVRPVAVERSQGPSVVVVEAVYSFHSASGRRPQWIGTDCVMSAYVHAWVHGREAEGSHLRRDEGDEQRANGEAQS